MSPVRVTWNRTIGRARSLFSTAFAVGGFLAASAALFAFRLDAAEGVNLSVASVWAMGVAPFLPALAAFLAGWGGLAVYFQTRALLTNCKAKGALHFAGHLFSAGIGAALASLAGELLL